MVAELEERPALPPGPGERFAGYGVMGLPFRSGHLLALRRFPASSVGPGYRSVWHRDPQGRWTFVQDVSAEQGCTRYFGGAVAEIVSATIDIDWTAPREFSILAAGRELRLRWQARLIPSVSTRLMNALAAMLPDGLWRRPVLLAGMSAVAGPMLRAGKVSLSGDAPNGQRFIANPLMVWLIAESTATLDGHDLGEIGPAPTPGQLADFRIPQRGVFAVGRAFFDADPRRANRDSSPR